MLPAGPVHPAPAAAEHRVIDGHARISARLGHQQDRQLRDRQAELVKFPAGPLRLMNRPCCLETVTLSHLSQKLSLIAADSIPHLRQ